MITTILWDVDGTLLDFTYSQTYALTKCFASAGLSITDEIISRYDKINDSYWKRLELGEVTKAQLLTGRFTTLFQEFGIEDVNLEAFCREYQMELGNIYRYVDNSIQVIKSLRGRVEQYVITNGVTLTQRNKLKLSGLDVWMKDIFISEEIGCSKPERVFFERCLEKVEEKDRGKILVVGDSLTSDIKGGVNAGLRTCWYRPEGSVNNSQWVPDYEISDLHQIYGILGMDGKSVDNSHPN